MSWGRLSKNDDIGKLSGPKWDQESYGKEALLSLELNSVRGNTMTWTEENLSPAVATQANFGLGATAFPYKFTTNFGSYKNDDGSGGFSNDEAGAGSPEEDASLNWKWSDGWGISGVLKNGPQTTGAEKTVTFYYQPPLIGDYTNNPSSVTGKITSKLLKSTISATFKNIGVWVYKATGQ